MKGMAMAGLSSTWIQHFFSASPATTDGSNARISPSAKRRASAETGQADQRLPEGLEIDRHHRQDRAQLDHHGEGFPVVAQPQQPFGHQQMRGGGDGQEFGQAFDDAQDDGEQNIVHARIPGGRRPTGSIAAGHAIAACLNFWYCAAMGRESRKSGRWRGWLWQAARCPVRPAGARRPSLLLLVFRFLPVPGTPRNAGQPGRRARARIMPGPTTSRPVWSGR